MDAITLICRNCGGVYDLTETENHKPCPACGAENCRPQAEGAALDVLRRATQQRLHCDFHRAESSYQHVLLDYPDEHEALWGLVLCRYCVEYVDDPRTGRRMPIVHAVQDTLMQEDPDFLQACENAPEAVRAQYEHDAAYIDDAQAEIRRLAEDRPPFDVFLCHKTTRPGEGEALTQDFTRAFQLYHMLDKAGYRVFFAPVEMEGVSAGENYEAGIYHALHTAKVMLVVCSDPDYLTSPWVQSEWKRYMRMMKPGGQKSLLPLLYGEMPAGKLPREFRMRKLQAIAMGEMGSAERLLAAVERLVGRKTGEAANPFITRETEGGVAIVKYTGPGGDVTIPAVLEGKRVVAVEEKAFEALDSLHSVVIPEGVTRIGEFAFQRCGQLQQVRLPETLVRIGDWAFYECGNLLSATLPRSLAMLGHYAFRACRRLESIHLPEGVRAIGCNPFACCDALHTLTVSPANATYEVRDGALFTRSGALIGYAPGYPAAVCMLPEGLKSIGNRAFNGCARLTAIRIPQSVTNIGQSAFSGCASLQQIAIPQGVRSLEPWLFTGCTALQSVQMGAVEAIGDNAFRDCAALRDLHIPAGVRQIHESAFTGCTALTLRVTQGSPAHAWAQAHGVSCRVLPAYAPESCFRTVITRSGMSIVKYAGPGGDVLIPPAIGGRPVTEIGKEAFRGHGGLTRVVIPQGVTNIGYGAFADCAALQEMRLPASVADIGGNAFGNCGSLRIFAVAAENPAFHARDNVLFSRANKLVCYPAGLSAPVYEIPSFVVEIAEAAFRGCSFLTGVKIPGGMMWIGNGAFESCISLTDMWIPDGVQGIGQGAFGNCPRLTLHVGENSRARDYARANGVPVRLNPVDAPGAPAKPAAPVKPAEPAASPVERRVVRPAPAGPQASNAADFATVPRMNGVEIVRYKGAQWEVVIPKEIYGKPVVSIGERAFEEQQNVVRVEIPEGVRSIGPQAFLRCGLREVKLPASLVRIAEDAFWRCSRLQRITVAQGNPVYRTQDGVLLDCNGTLCLCPVGLGMKEYTVPDTVRRIGGHAFSDNEELRRVVLPQGLTEIGMWAFAECWKLTSVQLPQSLTTLDKRAFAHCSMLARLDLPDGIAHVDAMTFADCDARLIVRRDSIAHHTLRRLDIHCTPVRRD